MKTDTRKQKRKALKAFAKELKRMHSEGCSLESAVIIREPTDDIKKQNERGTGIRYMKPGPIISVRLTIFDPQ